MLGRFVAGDATVQCSRPHPGFAFIVSGLLVHKRGVLEEREIEVVSWSWGLSVSQGSEGGRGATSGKAKPNEFTFTPVYDKASPLLAELAASGKHIKQVLLSARKSGEGQLRCAAPAPRERPNRPDGLGPRWAHTKPRPASQLRSPSAYSRT